MTRADDFAEEEEGVPQDEWCTKFRTRISFGKQMGSEQEENVRMQEKQTVKAQMRYPGFRVTTSYRIKMYDGTIYAIAGATDQSNTKRIVDLELIFSE